MVSSPRPWTSEPTRLFVQVNGRMEAYYRSRLLPPAPDVAPDFDPLDYVIFRARAAGLQVHAWINVFTAGMLTERPSHPDHVLNRRPDWVTVDRTGRSLWDYTWQEAQVYVPARMLDPGVPGVQQFVLDVALEVVDSYDVDGIHLDYVRYPSRRFGYHPESISRFMAEHGFDPMEVEQDAAAFVAVHGWEEFAAALGHVGRVAPEPSELVGGAPAGGHRRPWRRPSVFGGGGRRRPRRGHRKAAALAGLARGRTGRCGVAHGLQPRHRPGSGAGGVRGGTGPTIRRRPSTRASERIC